MKTEKDYEEFLELLNKHNVRYCVVGAFALAFHARPRYTKDMDVFVEPTTDNAKRLLNALDEFAWNCYYPKDKSTSGPMSPACASILSSASPWRRAKQLPLLNIDPDSIAVSNEN